MWKDECTYEILLDKYDGADYVHYDHLHMFGKPLYQSKYQFLISGLANGFSKGEILSQDSQSSSRTADSPKIEVHM